MSAADTYTFKIKPIRTEPQAESNFAGVVNDGNHSAMNGVVGSGPQTVDISGTPLTSPQTVHDNAVVTLTTPLNAAQVVFLVAGHPLNVSESDNTVATYFQIPVGVQTFVDVSRCALLYLEASGGDAAVSFWYNVV